MTAQLDLFEARRRADTACMTAASSSKYSRALMAAQILVRGLPQGAIVNNDTLTTAVLNVVGDFEARNMGAIVRRLERDGLLERNGDYAPSARSNGSPKPVRVRA